MLVFEERGKPEYQRKTSRSKGENQQQTQPTYGVDAGSWTRATLVGGECSHHGATLAPQGSSNCSRQFQFTHGNFNLLTAISIFSRQHSRHFSLCSPPVNFGGRQWPPKVKTQNQKSIFNVDLQNEKWKSQIKSRFTNTYASGQWVDNRRVFWSRKIISFIWPSSGGLLLHSISKWYNPSY